MKNKKSFTVHTDPLKVVARIKKLEAEAKFKDPNLAWHEVTDTQNMIKAELNTLYRLRHKQKNYTKPPVKTKVRGL